MLRPAACALVAGVIVFSVAVSGCGSKSTTSTVVTVPAGSTGVTGTNTDQADLMTAIEPNDQALAEQIALAPTDLPPDWVPQKVAIPYSQKAPKCPQYNPLQADLTLTGHAETGYANATSKIDADVEILQTPEQLQTDIGRIFVPSVTQCVGVRAQQSGQDAKYNDKLNYIIGGPKLMPFPKYGAATKAYRVIFYSPISQKPYVSYDVINIAAGRVLYSINVIAPMLPAEQAKAKQLEQTVAAKLVARTPAS